MVPLDLLVGLEVGKPGGPCRGQEGVIEPVSLGGAEGGVLSLHELG